MPFITVGFRISEGMNTGELQQQLILIADADTDINLDLDLGIVEQPSQDSQTDSCGLVHAPYHDYAIILRGGRAGSGPSSSFWSQRHEEPVDRVPRLDGPAGAGGE
jgi:hypothetical protein